MLLTASHRHLRHTFLRGAWAMGLAAVLAGCSTPPPGASPITNASQHWSGRMGLQVLDAEGVQTAQSFSGSFELSGSATAGELNMFNPLGSQVAQIRWNSSGAWLQQGDRLTPSASLSDLVQRTLGTDIPIAALFAWLQGQATTTAGWQVDLSQHPQGRITARRTHPAPQAQLRVVLQP